MVHSDPCAVDSNLAKMEKIFTLIGDSNVRRHLNPFNCRDRPLMLAAQFLPCSKLEVLSEGLRSVREESNVCVVSCVTNLLTSSDGSSTLALRLEPVLSDFFSRIRQACLETPDRAFLVCPPMYRKQPLWYRDGLPEVLGRFSSALMSDKPINLIAMPSFPNPDFEADGVHLTAFSGLEYILHMFDSASMIIDSLAQDPATKGARSGEATRLLEDRMVALEQDHRRLNQAFDLKVAIDSELDDIIKNERSEDSFLISGLEKIPSDIVGKPWQERAQRDVQAVVREVIKRECSIIFVQNITSRAGAKTETRYVVRLRSVEESRLIRDTFGAFFVGGKKPPSNLKKYSIRNLVTLETRVRLQILKIFAQRYRDSNQGAKTQVIGFETRPLLKLFPPEGSSDRRVKVFTFIDAIQKLPAAFTPEELQPVLEMVRYQTQLSGRLRSLFVVISDDLLPHPKSAKPKPPPSGMEADQSNDQSTSPVTGANANVVNSRKRSSKGSSGAPEKVKKSNK